MSKVLGLTLIGLVLATTAATGQIYQAGTTYANYQHQGSCGRMIGLDDVGIVQLVWMKDLTINHVPRHVYFNVRDETGWLLPGGAQIDPSVTAGSPTAVVAPEGWCYPAYSKRDGNEQQSHSCVPIDFLPEPGAYTPSWPIYNIEGGQPLAITLPKISRTSNDLLHAVSADVTEEGGVHRIYYSRGTPIFDSDEFGLDIEWDSFAGHELAYLDSAAGLAHTIAASRTGNRVAVAYTRPVAGFDNMWLIPTQDVYVMISENGGQTWGTPINITAFRAPSIPCALATGNHLCCSGDTLSAGADISLIFDNNNILHAAFPTYYYLHWDTCGTGPTVDRMKGIIWHWSEVAETITEIAEEWTPDSLVSWQLPMLGHYVLERPSLAIHPTDGTLYCVYLRYNREAYSQAGFLNADVFGTLSESDGVIWSVGANLTNTNPDEVPAPLGENENEQDVTVAELVQGERLHLTYLFDRDAVPDPEIPSLNDFCYHRLLTNAIPDTAWLDSRPFHVANVPCDTLPLADPELSLITLEDDTLIAGSGDSTHLVIVAVGLSGDTLGPDAGITVWHSGQGIVSELTYIANGTFSMTITAPADSGTELFDITQDYEGCGFLLGEVALHYVCDELRLADPERSPVTLEDDTLIAGSNDTTRLMIVVVNLQGDTLGPDVVLDMTHSGEGIVSDLSYVANGTFAATITAPADTGIDIFEVRQMLSGCTILLDPQVLHYVPADPVGDVPPGLPKDVALYPPQPNPFNASTRISYALPKAAMVDLRVYDVLGREVETLHSGMMEAGTHSFLWSPNAATGIYFLRLQAGNEVRTQKLMYLR